MTMAVRGRKPLGETAMTGAERQAKRFAQLKQKASVADTISKLHGRIAILERGIDEAIGELTGLSAESRRGLAAFSASDFSQPVEPMEIVLRRRQRDAERMLRCCRHTIMT
jgi:hypothetical protein